MAAEIFNIAKGRFVEWQYRVGNNDPANAAFLVALLKLAETNATLRDYDDWNALLGAAGNEEADFSSYARKTLTDADITFPAPDDSNDRFDVDLPNQTWDAAEAGNFIEKALVGYDSDSTGGTDADVLPASLYDVASIPTNGSDLELQFDAAGWGRAA